MYDENASGLQELLVTKLVNGPYVHYHMYIHTYTYAHLSLLPAYFLLICMNQYIKKSCNA